MQICYLSKKIDAEVEFVLRKHTLHYLFALKQKRSRISLDLTTEAFMIALKHFTLKKKKTCPFVFKQWH